MARALTLLGQGPSRHNCPFDTELWASLTVLGHEEYRDAPIDKVFCFDKPERKDDELVGLKVAVERGIPIVGWSWLADWEPITEAYITEPYPLRELQKRFNTYYFKNDTSYMIALAIYLGYEKLRLWGFDQGGGPIEKEGIYTMGRPYAMYWLGVATGMGVDWELAPDSILLREN